MGTGLFRDDRHDRASLHDSHAHTLYAYPSHGGSHYHENISKIKLTAVENVSQSNEIGIGNYVVGRDIPAGTCTLSTNMTMDTEFENLGWNIGIYNEESGDVRSQSLNPGNMDVTVKLSEGEIITTSFYNTDDAVPADSAKLIFTPVSN